MHYFANPARFQRFASRLLPWLLALFACLMLYGGYLALFSSPPDYQQGEAVRIMYVHVPSAWMSTLIYVTMAAGSASFLIWRHPLGDILAQASAPIGAGFTLMTLVTGSIWGKPMWGTWWVWDARLTSVLVLFFLYIGYIALAQSLPRQESSQKTLAVMALIGAVNLPIIKFSVEWWSTLHQPASIIRAGKPTIDSSMLTPLLILIAAFMVFYIYVVFVRMQTLFLQQKLRRLAYRY